MQLDLGAAERRALPHLHGPGVPLLAGGEQTGGPAAAACLKAPTWRQGSPRMQPCALRGKARLCTACTCIYAGCRHVVQTSAPALRVLPVYTARLLHDHRLPPPRLHVFTLRAIAPGEELCWDYGEEYWDTMGKRGKLKQ